MNQQSHYIPDWLDKRAKLTPDRVALIDYSTGSETTFAEWNERANRTANYLRSLGVTKGDRVAVYASNRSEYLDLFWAAPKIGAMLQNLNWRLTVHELMGIIEDGAPTVLIYSEDWRPQVEALRPSFTTVKHVVAMTNPGPGERDITERDSMSAQLDDVPELTLDDPWGIYYTGGTTGLPKGAVLTHGNVTWNSINTITSWGINSQHTAALQLPFFHIGGPNIFMAPLVHAGGTTILCSGFDPDETFDLVERSGITHYVAVPTMFRMLQEHPRWIDADFSKLELVISGGAPCPLPVMEKFWDRGIDFKMGYGLTEASGNNFWLPPEMVQEKIGSVGYPLFHIDMKIIRGDGTECADDEEGELLIRGPHIVAGYWKNPEATADTIRDGWLHTGDIARRDEDGCFSILGRSKEMFISGGENVYPAEIESVLSAHPLVMEAAVVGVPHETWGEIGRAFVVVADDYNEEDLQVFLAERLAKYKLPRSIIVLDALPLTAIGKLDKKLLARILHEGSGMSVPTLPGVTAETVTTDRLTTRVLFSGPEDGIPVLFIHGNFSSATWWEGTMVALPPKYRAITPDQRGFGGSDPTVKVNAVNGMGDFVDDAIALMDHLGYDRFHLVGNSLGGLVAWWMMADRPGRLISVTLAGPGSPYGFGGTKDAHGTPTTGDFAGSGGGLIRPALVQGLLDGDRTTDFPTSPRSVLRLLVWGPPFIPDREDALVDAMFQVQIGDTCLPGDKATSPNWPYVSPGKWGATNAMSPKYIGNLVERILASDPKVKVLWIYGADDVAVSNSAASDPGTWGPSGLLPGYPGAKEYPPQPMMDQIRTILDEYARRGGTYAEVAVEGSGHVPFLSHPDDFNRAFHSFLEQAG